ncbi:MAG: M23 family metallopeptidase [Treponema sp.]|nr:M23 family metallopeptidase [Treponema sp.]
MQRFFKRIINSMSQLIRKKFYTLIPSPIGRIAVNSVIAFCIGAVMCMASVAIASRIHTQNGIGGLETTGVPQFTAYSLSNSETAFTDDISETDELKEAIALLEEDSAASEVSYFTYRVKSGDMIGIIADNYGVTQDTIISVNGIRQSRLLQVGQYLKIPSLPGILYTVKQNGETPETIAKKFDVSAEKCARVNSLEQTSVISAGITLFVPDAALDFVTLQEINGDLFRRPLRSRYWLSSYYGWRKSPFSGARSFHTGIDMAAPQGTPIYAALAGRVTTAGYNDIYGNYVIITHHSGYRTLYGHMSSILVVRGQSVDSNTQIGRVGSTGMSTGPHLHFTVFKWNSTVNPLTLLQ